MRFSSDDNLSPSPCPFAKAGGLGRRDKAVLGFQKIKSYGQPRAKKGCTLTYETTPAGLNECGFALGEGVVISNRNSLLTVRRDHLQILMCFEI